MAIMRKRRRWKPYVLVAAGVALLLTAIISFAVMSRPSKEYKVNIFRLAVDKKQGESINREDIEMLTLYSKNAEMAGIQTGNVEGMKAMRDMSSGEIVTESMVYKDEGLASDERYQRFDGISIFADIVPGDFVDVRIRFANGEDYIVINHKKVENITEEKGLILRVCEEEILRMSSAQVDAAQYEGTQVYAVKYIQNYQEPAVSNYLLNSYVISLAQWDPNIIDRVFTEDEIKLRSKLEQNLKEFME